MGVETRALSADVPVELADKVDAMAGRMKRSPEWAVKQALAAWVDREEYRYQLTLEGLADVDAGRVISHEAMKAWAASLGTDNPLPLPQVGE